jgi:hypothetical protein
MAARYPLVLNGTTIQELQSGDVLNGYVTPNSTDTLTNKTLTSPVINTPTGIVKGDVGLGNVDNTSDATKNSASATLTNKTLTSPVINTPTGIVKGDVGLGNVDNTSDATKNSASATLTNKTIEAGVFNNGYTEETVTANTSTAYTIDLANGSLQILTLTGNCTFTFPTATAGKGFTLLLLQDATGARTATWPASVKWPAGTAPTITATASKGDKFVFVGDGTYWWGSNAGQNYL